MEYIEGRHHLLAVDQRQAAELESLLDGGYFPSKNNFTTRLMQNADKESSYTQVLAPWTTRNKGESHD